MRAAVLTGRQQVEVGDVPEPELLPGSCVVAVERCGIGGPDLVAWSTGQLPAPAWFGHEWVGRVAAVGDGSPDRFVGERVVGARRGTEQSRGEAQSERQVEHGGDHWMVTELTLRKRAVPIEPIND